MDSVYSEEEMPTSSGITTVVSLTLKSILTLFQLQKQKLHGFGVNFGNQEL